MSSAEFIQALELKDLAQLRGIPKTDFHSHGSLGFRLDVLRARTQGFIPEPPYIIPTFVEFGDYLKAHLQALLYTQDGFIASIADTLAAAVDDSVTELEISIDCQIFPEFGNANAIVNTLKRLAESFPQVIFRPEIGINREWNDVRMQEWVVPLIDSGYFAALDLYGNEMLGEPEGFVRYYDMAKRKGMRCKAHAGEYRDAEFVRHSVEVLDLDEVQHGISAAQSPEVMQWLADHRIRLNVCPTSNLRLARISHMAAHPIRQLVDAGVHVTINSDDLLVFNQSVSEEYLNLYEAGVLTAEELNEIRKRAFRS